MSNAGRMVLVLLLAAGLAAAVWVVIYAVVSPDGIEPETVPTTAVIPSPGADLPEPRVPRLTQNSAKPPDPIPASAAESPDADSPEPVTPDPGAAPAESGPSLVIQVVDPDGRPVAGVPVKLVGLREPIWKGLTAEPDGKVSVNNIAEILARYRKHHRITAAIDCPLQEPVETELDLTRLPTTPVKLAIPPTGSLRIRLEGPGAKAGASMLLRRKGVLLDHLDAVPTKNAVEVLLPAVGLGLDFRLTVWPHDHDFVQIDDREILGPIQAGEEVTVTVRIDQLYPILAGRAVNLRGQPIRNREIEASFDYVEGSVQILDKAQVKTDNDGRFRFRMKDLKNHPLTAPRSLELAVDDAAGLPGMGRAVIDLSKSRFPPGETRIGDVVLRSGGQVVSGRVVDEKGRPISRARVLVYRGQTLEERKIDITRRHFGLLPDIIDMEALEYQARTFEWLAERDLSHCKTDRNGAFSLHGICPPGPLRVVIQNDGWYGEPARLVQRGARDEVFVMKKAATLTGSIRLAPGVNPDKLHVRLVGEPAAVGENADPSHWPTEQPPPQQTACMTAALHSVKPASGSSESNQENGDPARHCTFCFDELGSGLCRVEIGMKGQPEPVWMIPGVKILAGHDNVPSELQEIDLTRSLRTIRVTVVTEQENPPPEETEVRIFRGCKRQGADRARRLRDTDEECHTKSGALSLSLLLDPHSRLDLEVMAPGYRVKRIENVRGDVRAVLRPGLPIRLVFPEDMEQLDNCVYVVVLTCGVNNRRFLFRSDQQPIYSGHTLVTVATRVSRPGRYRVNVRRGDNPWGEIVLLADHEIVVRDLPTEQKFVIPVTTPKR